VGTSNDFPHPATAKLVNARCETLNAESSSSSPGSPHRIAIIGGGISGLAAAQRLVERSPSSEITLFEATDRLGGVIQSTERNGFLFEHSADSFIVNDELPFAGELCQKIGVELIETSTAHRGALILRDRIFHPVPEGLHLMSVRQLSGLLATPLLSWPGRLRAAYEPFISKRTSNQEESLEQFATRRFGREMFERIIQPLVSGIYTADPAKLSVAAALPQYVRQEREYGSLRKAALAGKNKIAAKDRGARYSMFRSPKAGMRALLAKLQQTLESKVEIRLSTPVRSLRRDGDQWEIDLGDNKQAFSHVIAATSATSLSKLLGEQSLANELAQIEHVSTALVCLGFRRGQVSHPLNAFGCVIPAIENRKVLAISFTNVKFPSRAPNDCVLLRVFVGGALQPELVKLDDDALTAMVLKELEELLGVSGSPTESLIVRWPKTTPQYHLGHNERLQTIERSLEELPGLVIAGNAYRGVGIPQCIRSGWQAVDRILEA